MRKIIAISFTLLFVFFSSNLFSQESPFNEIGFDAALQKSKAENKPILLFLYATWCSHCNKMKKEVFTEASVIDFLSKNFVCVSMDAEKGEGVFLKDKYNIRAFPGFVFLNVKAEQLYGFSGEYKPENFISEAKTALIPERQLPFLEKEFNADFKNADKCYAYITTLKKTGADVSEPAKKYLQTQTEPQLVSMINWRIIANGISEIDSREFQYVLKHQKEFAGVSSPVRVEKKIINIVQELLRPYVEKPDTIGYVKMRPLAKSIQMFKTDSLVFTYDLMIGEYAKNWNFYKKSAIESVDKYYGNHPEKLKEVALNFQKNVTDPASLKFALQWTTKSVEIKPSADGYLLAAKLSQKITDPKKARDYAEQSKKFSESLGFSTKDADDFLKELK